MEKLNLPKNNNENNNENNNGRNERWEILNEYINDYIGELLKSSKRNCEIPGYNLDPTNKRIPSLDKYGNRIFGRTTSRESVGAALCFYQAIRLIKGDKTPHIALVAKEISQKGYFENGTGVTESLFDNYGLKRARHVNQIFDTLKQGRIVTAKVCEDIVPISYNRRGFDYVNIVGVKKNKFIIDTPKYGRISMDIKTFIQVIDVVWIW